MEEPREVRFPVPWGHLAGQEWGDSNSPKKVLAVHGWMDNLNSFQKLCPLLPSDLHIIAIDLSGHGLSSPRPAGCGYNILEFAIELKRLADMLGRTNFAILAHSMGAMISFLFAGLFPEMVSHLISLDMFTISLFGKNLLSELTAKTINDFLNFEKKHSQARVYKDLDEVVDRRMCATPNSLSRESAEIIMRRGTMEHEGGVILRTDPRLKFVRAVSYNFEAQEELLQRYKGKLLVIQADNQTNKSPDFMPHQKFVEIFEKNCSAFKLFKVEGTHTVHLDEPEKIVGVIIKFLEDYHGTLLPDQRTGSRL